VYVLDSSAIIEVLNATTKGKKVSDLVRGHFIGATTICYVEVMVGARGKALRATADFFDAVTILPFDKKAADITIKLQNELYQCGKLLGRGDLLIAGICKNRKAPLITCDDDFVKVKGLKVICVN
jgi:predicted nucleic acid-binding protein